MNKNYTIANEILGMAMMTNKEAVESLIQGMKIIAETANDVETYMKYIRELDELVKIRKQVLIQQN